MKNDELLDAISGLDPDILEEHLKMKERSKQRRHRSPWFKASAVAACFCLVLTVSLVIPLLAPNGADPMLTEGADGTYILPDIGKTQYFAEESFWYEGGRAFSSFGFITHMGYGDKTLTLRIEKLTDAEFYLKIHGYDYKTVFFPTRDGDELLEVSICGEPVTELPTAPGAYEITVDYSRLAAVCDIEPYIAVFEVGASESLGAFSINAEGYTVASAIFGSFPIASEIKEKLVQSELFGGLYTRSESRIEYSNEYGEEIATNITETKLVICHVGDRENILRELEGIIDGSEDYIEFKEVEYSYNYLLSMMDTALDVIYKLGTGEDTLYLLDVIHSCRVSESDNKVIIRLNKKQDDEIIPLISDFAEFGLTQEEYDRLIEFKFREEDHLY